MTSKTKPRPVHLDLRRIRFPINAVTSFGHRVSGLALFLATPICIYLLDLSLANPQGFARAKAILESGLAKFIIFLLLWALVHHLLAGLRCIAIDLDRGVEEPTYQQTAWAALVAAPLIAALLAGAGL